MKKNLFSLILIFLFALVLFIVRPRQIFAAEENLILKFSGNAYATSFAGMDHHANASAKFLKEKRGKIIISDLKDFQIKFEAKVGEDLWLRDCEECKVWFELYKEIDGKWQKIFEKEFSGGSKIETKSETFDTSKYGYTQQELIAKYKVRAKARAKLSIVGEKSWGPKDFVFFIGVAPEGKTSLSKGSVLEWLYLSQAREKSYEQLAKWAEGVYRIELTYSDCLFKLTLSYLKPYMAEIGLAASNFILSFTDYFEPFPTDFPSVVETGISTTGDIMTTLISTQDFKEVVSDFIDPTKNLKEIWSALEEINKIPDKVNEICTALTATKSQMGEIQSKAIEIKNLISQERTSVENVFYKRMDQISSTEDILNKELSLISNLKNNYLTNKTTGRPMSEVKKCGKGEVGCYTYNETAKMVRNFYRPFNYIWEDETIVDYFLTGKITEAKINRINEEQEAARAAEAARLKPNLQVSLSLKEPVKVNQTVSLNFNLSNVGNSEVSADGQKTALKVLLDGTTFQEIKFSSFGKIAPNETKTISFDWKPAAAKDYSFYLRADPDNVVAETIENDNNFSKTIAVSAEDLPDLVAESLEIQSPEAIIHPNEEVKIKASIKNFGKAKAENFKVAIYLNPEISKYVTTFGLVLAEKTIDSLDMGEIATIETKWKVTSYGYSIGVGVDTEAGTKWGRVREENKDNNTLIKPIVVEMPRHELKISCPNCPPLVTYAGIKKIFNFVVENAGNIKDEVVLDYEMSPGVVLGPEFSETSFQLEAGESKEVFVTLNIPRDQPPGDYSIKVLAQTKQKQSPVSIDLKFKVESPYRIEVFPLCHGKICSKEEFDQKEIEPDKIVSFDFRIQNKGQDVDLGFWIEGNYNGKFCGGDECYGISLPPEFSLKKGEAKDVSLKVKGKEAGDYNLTLKFNAFSKWILETYSMKLKIKPYYDFGFKILKTYKLEPNLKWQKLAEIEIENKSNTKAKLKMELVKDSASWETIISQPEIELAIGEKKTIEFDAYSKEAAQGWLMEAGSQSVVLKFTMVDKTKTATLISQVKEFHKISINNWSKKKIPQSEGVPLGFAVRNLGNVKEKITVKMISELKLEPNVIVVEAEPYSFKEERSGLGYINTTIDSRDFPTDKEYQIYIVALAGNVKDEAITKIVIEPKFQFLCEERDYCSHAVKKGGKTQYRIQMLNGLDKDITIALTGQAPEDEKWSWKLEQSEVALKKGESKNVLLEVEASKGAEGSFAIVLKGEGDGIEEEIKIITKIDEATISIYPGWTVISLAPTERCGNGKCEAGETKENCCKDCGCPEEKICDEEKNQCVELVCEEDKDCDDKNACTEDKCENPNTPEARCARKTISLCKNDDGCCPSTCNKVNDNDCQAQCGNGICEPSETQANCCKDCGCEEGEKCEANRCVAIAQCGNGRIEGSEACDDGAANGTYGHCKSDCSGPGPRCGDGVCQSANENTENCPSDCPTPPPAAQCNDSDNGQDKFVKGTTTRNGSSSIDYCQDSDTVHEYYCSNNEIASINLDCPTNYICNDGRCIEKPPTCADSDNGKDIWTKGTVTRNGSTYIDYCTNNVTVHEYFCDNNNLGEEDISCPSGTICQDGRCLHQATECSSPYTDCLTTIEATQKNCQMPPGPQCAEIKWCFICP